MIERFETPLRPTPLPIAAIALCLVCGLGVMVGVCCWYLFHWVIG